MFLKKLAVAMGTVALAGTTLLSGGYAHADAPEIMNPSTPDIGVTMEDPVLGTVIHINPMICAQMGPLVCGFFRKHEQGHANRHHTKNWWYGATPHGQRAAEAEADCEAAKNSSDAEAAAAIEWFQRTGASGDYRHGTGFERAAIVRRCHAGKSSGSAAQMCTKTVFVEEVRMVPQVQMRVVCGPYGCWQTPVTIPVRVRVRVPRQVTAPCASATTDIGADED